MCYIYLTTVLFLFPPDLPVSGSNMSKSLSSSPNHTRMTRALTKHPRLLCGSLRHRAYHLNIPVDC